MPKFHGQNKKRIDPRYFLEETRVVSMMEAPFPIDKGQVRQHAKTLAQSDASMPGDGGETASLILRGATMQQLEDILSDLLSSGEITSEQLEVAAERMREIEEKHGMLPGDDKDINQSSYGSDYHPNDPRSPGYSRS